MRDTRTMPLDEATTLAYLAFGAIVLLVAAILLRKDLKNAGGALIFSGVGTFAAIILVVPLYRFGLVGTIDSTVAWKQTMPLVGWMLIGAFAVATVLPVPAFAHAFKLARTGFAQHRFSNRVMRRLAQLRRDASN